jgi:hypothetical protein
MHSSFSVEFVSTIVDVKSILNVPPRHATKYNLQVKMCPTLTSDNLQLTASDPLPPVRIEGKEEAEDRCSACKEVVDQVFAYRGCNIYTERASRHAAR